MCGPLSSRSMLTDRREGTVRLCAMVTLHNSSAQEVGTGGDYALRSSVVPASTHRHSQVYGSTNVCERLANILGYLSWLVPGVPLKALY